jgi:hypothetical protein
MVSLRFKSSYQEQKNGFNDLNFEEEMELKKSLNDYFQIVHNYMEKEALFNEYNEEEKKNIKKQIENFIHVQLYDKIYPKFPVEADVNIYQTMKRLDWIKPEMLDKSLKYLDEKMIDLMKSFIKNMHEEMSPTNKLREFEKVYLIINNIITLYGYDKSMFINILAYVFIKGEQNELYSTLRYIEIFLSDEMKEEKGYLISKFKEVIGKVIGLSQKDLVGVNEDEFKQNCNK